MTTLNCEQAAELFSPQIDGFISAREKTMLRAHLDHCRHCADEFAEWIRISEAMRQIPGEVCPVPDFSRNVIKNISDMERQRSAAGKIAAWKKGIAAAAAAAFIMAGSLGINMATKGPQVVNVPGDPGQDTNIVAYNNDEKPATGTKNEPTKPEQEDPKTEPGETNVGAETGDVQPGSNNSKPEQTATGGQKPTQGNNTGNAATAIKNEPQAVLLGSNMVIKSTVLKLMVSDTDLAREKAEGLTATVGGKASYLGEQNTGSGIVNLLRITVSKDTAVKTVNSLAALGTTISRNDENRNITSQYNSLAARYNELVESSQDTPEATAEIESMKQQLDQWAEDAEVYTVVLWLQ